MTEDWVVVRCDRVSEYSVGGGGNTIPYCNVDDGPLFVFEGQALTLCVYDSG